MNRWLQFTLLFLILIAGTTSDLYTKHIAARELKDAAYITVIDGCLEFAYTENRGMVFGIMGDQESMLKHYLLTGTTIIAIGFIIFIIWQLRHKSFLYHFPFFLILSGAFGNLIDRLRFGMVVDFIHIFWQDKLDWPYLFNVADAYICIGGVFLAVLLFFKKDMMEQTIFPHHVDIQDSGKETGETT